MRKQHSRRISQMTQCVSIILFEALKIMLSIFTVSNLRAEHKRLSFSPKCCLKRGSLRNQNDSNRAGLSGSSCIGPRVSGDPAPWCFGRLCIFARYSLRSRFQLFSRNGLYISLLANSAPVWTNNQFPLNYRTLSNALKFSCYSVQVYSFIWPRY